MTSKAQIRRKIAALVQTLDLEQKKREDEQMIKNILKSEIYERAQCIFCFVSTAREVNTRLLLEDALLQNKTVCVPRSLPDGIMEAIQIQSLNDLESGRYGIMEPKSGKVIPSMDIDLAIIPCCCASRKGARLGYGKGYYDRFLNGTKMKKIVLCREGFLREDIPMEAFDQRMDIVCTDKAWIEI